MTRHTGTTRYVPGWNEYRPECSCGWVGSHWRTRRAAQDWADRHAAAANLYDEESAEG